MDSIPLEMDDIFDGHDEGELDFNQMPLSDHDEELEPMMRTQQQDDDGGENGDAQAVTGLFVSSIIIYEDLPLRECFGEILKLLIT